MIILFAVLPVIEFQYLIFLLSYAIKGSPNQKLLLEDIYYAIESRVCINKQSNHSDFNIILFL